jgi:hypothetical protein
LQQPEHNTQVPYVDIAQKISVKVVDASGAPVANARIGILNLNGSKLLNLKSPASGTVSLFPTFDKLPKQFQISVSDSAATTPVSQSVDLTTLAANRDIILTLPTQTQPLVNIDIALVIDSTSSMGDEIKFLQEELTQVFKDTAAANPGKSIQAGLVVYRDEGDQYVHLERPFTANLEQFTDNLALIEAKGGGDYPEAMDQAMDAAMQLQWREHSTKILLLVADAPPHDENMKKTWASVEDARNQQIHIVPVAASGVGDTAEFLMRSMAAVTNSRYIFITDDSGVGNDHAEPKIDCYAVTRLDQSLKRVMASLIKGQRVEPGANEIIRTEGNYNAGICDMPAKP